MKKINLSKETLRVLTAQEATEVAGGATQTCIPRAACGTESRPVTACETSRCPTETCPPATSDCPPPATSDCPPATSACPPTSAVRCTTETRVRPRCVIP